MYGVAMNMEMSCEAWPQLTQTSQWPSTIDRTCCTFGHDCLLLSGGFLISYNRVLPDNLLVDPKQTAEYYMLLSLHITLPLTVWPHNLVA